MDVSITVYITSMFLLFWRSEAGTSVVAKCLGLSFSVAQPATYSNVLAAMTYN